jgi:hypothetical protein
MSNEEIVKIGEIPFLDVMIPVYHDKYGKDPNSPSCVWRMRNPDSCYQGIVYMNWETREMTYPEDAIIPEQTERDREMLPQFVITSREELDEEFISKTQKYFEREYIRRNV